MDKEEQNRYILTYMPMIYKLAGKFGKCEFYDCVQEGVLGLVNGLENYDSEKGNMLSYVYPFVRGRIINYMNKSHKKYSELTMDNDDFIVDPKTEPQLLTDTTNKEKLLERINKMENLTKLEKNVIVEILNRKMEYKIAQELHCSLNNISRAKQNAIRKIKESIKNEI